MTTAIGDTREVAASGSTPFIGRSAELDLLCSAARGDGPATAWLVGGEAGVGKTRLVEEVMHRVEAGESSIGRGSCLHMAQGALPFVAVAEALSALCAVNDAELVGQLVEKMPELAIVLPDVVPVVVGSASVVGDDASRLRLFDSISRLLARLSEVRPVCIVLEDLHWAEPSTRDLLSFLVAHLGELPVAIIGTYRSDAMSRTHPLRPLLAELDRHPRVEHLTLAPFDAAELAAFADARLGEPPTARLLDDVAVRSGGNAFTPPSCSMRSPPTAGRCGASCST